MIIIIIKLFSDSSLCWLVKNKRVNKHLMIDLLWMTIHLDIKDRSPFILELGLRVRNNVLRDLLKLLKQGGQYYWDKLCFLLLIIMIIILSLQGTSELYGTACMCKFFTTVSFCWVQNLCILQFCVLKNTE